MLTQEQRKQAESTKLSTNFSLWEAIRSESYPELVEYPSAQVIENLAEFYQSFVQKIRDSVGRLRINSGWRNTRLNAAVGGAARSVHRMYAGDVFLGVAADIMPLDESVLDAFHWIRDNLPDLKCAILYRSSRVTRTPFIHIDSGVFRPSRAILEKISARSYVPYKEARK